MLPSILISQFRLACVALCLSAVCALIPCHAQQPAPAAAAQAAAAPGTPTLKITTREVLLDVLVVDKAGQPVPGLKASDFAVSEEGESQVVRRVDEHHPMSAATMDKLAAAPSLPPNTFTNFTPVRNTDASVVLLLDAMDSPPEAQMAMREQLINYLKHMHPGPPIAIFQLDTEMRLIQGFTSDPKVLLAAAESKRDMPSLSRPTAAPRSYTADAQYRRVLMETLRDGMRSLGSYMSGFPGRKNLIWFTGRVPMTTTGMGFGNPFRDGMTVMGGEGYETSELTDVLTVSRVAVYPVDTRGLVTPMSSASQPGMPRSRMNNDNYFFNHANLDEVALETGGKAYYNTNDFTRVITDVTNTGSSYYTVAYATTNTKWNGQLRHIKVMVDRPNVTLQHKQGYYAYSLEKREENGIASIEKRKDQSESQPANTGTQNSNQPSAPSTAATPDDDTVQHRSKGGLASAMALGAIQPTEIIFGAKLEADANPEKLGKEAPMPADNFLKPEWQHKPFRTYSIYFNADSRRLRFTQTPAGLRHGQVEFVAVVYSADGHEVNSLINTAAFDVNAAQYHKLMTSGVQVKLQVAVPVKGNFFMRLGVHDVASDQVGALEIPLDQVKPGLASGTRAP